MQKARINILEEQQRQKQQQHYRYGKKININDATGTTASETSNDMEKKFGIHDQNIVLHQCINELASTLDEHKKNLMPISDTGESLSPKVLRKKSLKSATTSTSTSSTNFVTVIEVKENKSATNLNKMNATTHHVDDSDGGNGGNEEDDSNVNDDSTETFATEDEEVSRTATKFSTFDKKINEVSSAAKVRTNITPSLPTENNKKKMPPR